MDSLRESIGLNAYAQRNPINEYRIAGAELFDEMIAGIREDAVMSLADRDATSTGRNQTCGSSKTDCGRICR